MAETIYRTLESGRSLTPEEYQTASGIFLEYLNRSIEVGKEQLLELVLGS
jgi:hypothetical protein